MNVPTVVKVELNCTAYSASETTYKKTKTIFVRVRHAKYKQAIRSTTTSQAMTYNAVYCTGQERREPAA